ncbi:uncharacterized protein LOC117176433 [Belonocnema kinseyi]|uniref:uncharacterized protein LOC117176433 n=1 Tax=Belonocnema kinseyi TaxID=2817044 RepID=UPI00143CC70A|nr:uncharacterized protein LOC117176433 [Belonocnema kinseyi]
MHRSGPYADPRVLTPADLNHAHAQQLLRVGGCLKHSVLNPHERHPYILPATCPFIDLVVDSCPQRTLNKGTQLILATLRRQFWILRCRQVVKSRIMRCVVCIRHRAVTATQLMGNFPSNRLHRTRAFLHSGVDFAGPYRIQAAPGPAYRRLASRRGICFTFTSDQDTNFVGADAQHNCHRSRRALIQDHYKQSLMIRVIYLRLLQDINSLEDHSPLFLNHRLFKNMLL